MNKTYFNWSSGKDAAIALHTLQQQGESIDLLLTTVNGHYDRVSMHGLRIDLLQRQCEAIGIPLQLLKLPENPTMEEYNELMSSSLLKLKEEGFGTSVFGDIFLEDLKKYRDEMLQTVGFKAKFPIWKKNTTELIQHFIQNGFKAKIICLNSEKLPKSFLGRDIDESFLNDLPPNVDPCGENGEFHTFCYDGPIFQRSVSFQVGEAAYREYDVDRKVGYWFLDLK